MSTLVVIYVHTAVFVMNTANCIVRISKKFTVGLKWHFPYQYMYLKMYIHTMMGS